jgi:DNA (cytosine-5)-methyltransferase 1
MKYASVCSGIGAAEWAWDNLGWECTSSSEVEPFACAILKKRHSEKVLHGDFREVDYENEHFELLVGGTPCQAFSIAGFRKGLHEKRGSLSLSYVELCRDYRPTWFVWENVTGVLSSNGGRDFGSLIQALAELGYGFAWRVLDAQHFGVPQQRKRVFLVGYLGDWRPPAAVLYDSETCGRDLRTSEEIRTHNPTLTLSGVTRLFRLMGYANYKLSNVASTVCTADYKKTTDLIENQGTLRRWTPLEYERLMGFPDDYTKIPWKGKRQASLETRVMALGNSMAVPVMYWLGQRIDYVNLLVSERSS